MLDTAHKAIFGLLKPFAKVYLARDRHFRHHGLSLQIRKGVFHPGFFFSSLFFAEYLESLPLTDVSFCEIGAGSGLLSFTALKKNANVCAVEISETALEGLRLNLENNFSGNREMRIVKSDVFSNVDPCIFDVVVVNPPYFFRDHSDEAGRAWNCGMNGEFFQKFFGQLRAFTHEGSTVLMSLADNCELERIFAIAGVNGYTMSCVYEKKIRWEKNFIFKVLSK